MYTVILPFSTTYIGLALGFFSAGVRRKLIEHRKLNKDLVAPRNLDANSKTRVHAVFENYADVAQTIDSLTARGITPKQFTIFGKDSDELRRATAALHAKRLDKVILLFAAIGLTVGAVWGYIGCPKLATTLPSVIMSALMAGFCGTLLGGLAGAQIAAVLQIDNGPATDATMREASVDAAEVALSISLRDEAQRQAVVEALGEHRVGFVRESKPDELVLQVAV
jgi:hypothetical protein